MSARSEKTPLGDRTTSHERLVRKTPLGNGGRDRPWVGQCCCVLIGTLCAGGTVWRLPVELWLAQNVRAGSALMATNVAHGYGMREEQFATGVVLCASGSQETRER